MTLANQMPADVLRETENRNTIDDTGPTQELPAWIVSFLMKRRQVLIMELGEIEDLLRLERSITPRRKRVPER